MTIVQGHKTPCVGTIILWMFLVVALIVLSDPWRTPNVIVYGLGLGGQLREVTAILDNSKT